MNSVETKTEAAYAGASSGHELDQNVDNVATSGSNSETENVERSVLSTEDDNSYSSSETENSEDKRTEIVGRGLLRIESGRKVVKRKKRLPSWAFRMLHLIKDITIMVLVAVAYAALSNDPPKVGKGPPAYPFFPQNIAFLTDWYRGQVSNAIEEARTSDVSFIMFYAPWSAESQSARKHFHKAANFMKEQVTFAAVNCWQPGTECRTQYSKVFNWPVLIAYPSHGRGIQYNGPISAPHIIKFLKNICQPFKRVQQPLFSGDAYIHIEVDASPNSQEYAVAYSTALRLLEKDPLRDIPITISTKAPNNPTLSIVMWNETLIYNVDSGWRTDLLLTWIVKNLRQISPWVSPSGMKSLSLSTYVKPGPALILFVPRNPLVDNVDYKLMTIAYDYYQCEDSPNYLYGRKLSLLSSYGLRLGNYLKYNELKVRCNKSSSSRSEATHIKHKISKPIVNIWTNNTCCFIKGGVRYCDKCDKHLLFQSCGDSCLGSYSSIVDEVSAKACQEKIETRTSTISGEEDPLSPSSLKKRYHTDECLQFLAAEEYEPQQFTSTFTTVNDQDRLKVAGLGCKTNTSLYFLAMDSLLYYHFAETLGVDVLNKKHKAAAVIVNERMETHHIMEGEVNDVTLIQFVRNFSLGLLERALNSNTQIKTKKTHSYVKVEHCDQENFCVKELNTGNFLPTIMQYNKAVVVMYYSKQCSFCNGISYSFLGAARKFSNVGNIVFTRIDGDLNLLPWEYTMYSYPTILFFPAFRKSESRAFPRNIPLSVENIIGFIMTNLEPNLKIQAMWSICNQTKFADEKALCLSSLRLEILSVIEATLSQWRTVPVRRKREIFRKLQLLKHLHLVFAHSSENKTLIKHYLNKLNTMPDICGNYYYYSYIHQERNVVSGKQNDTKGEL